MSKTMALPKIGVNMTEAIVDTWYVTPGDKIKEGDPILLAETDKATQDIYATESGIIGKLLVEQGDRVQIHDPIMLLLDDGETMDKETVLIEQDTKAPAEEQHSERTSVIQNPKTAFGARLKISPLAKKLAHELRIDINLLKPEAPGKRIVKKDVMAFEAQSVKTVQPVKSVPLSICDDGVLERIRLSPIRKVIASRMSESNLDKPSAALTLTAQADAVIALRERFKSRDMKVGYNDIFVKIVGQALREHRNINAVINGEEIIRLSHINIGVAVDSERGLVVPVIRDADEKNIRQIADDFASKIAGIRENKINGDDLTGGTFTITNLGMFEIEQFVPIINPPECCILAIGSMKKEFVPDENDLPKLITAVKLTLVFDHKIVDGAPAARFLQAIKRYVECPELLI